MDSIQEISDVSRAGDLKGLLNELPTQNLEPLWTQMSAMVPASPNPVASAHIWKYDEALPHLQKAARLVPEEQAERRVLMLVNPSMSKYTRRLSKHNGLLTLTYCQARHTLRRQSMQACKS
jgi:gentisate 1,2-dioxygenase